MHKELLTTLQERAAQYRARPNGSAATAAQESEIMQSVVGRVCHHKAQTGRL